MGNVNNGVLDGLRKTGPRFRDLTVEGVPGAILGYRLCGATASGPPVAGSWKARDIVPDATGTAWVCTAAGSPGTWIQLGDKPYQFRPETYGAKRNGKLCADGAMAIGSVLTSATANFTAADQGKYILVWGAITATSSNPGYLFATITQVNSSTSVTLSAAATIAVNTTGFLYGTDDTTAIQAAVNAATTYSLNGNGAIGVVQLLPGIYCAASQAAVALGTNTTTLGNAVITIPAVSPTSGVKAQLQIIGAGCAQLPHWTQPQPPQGGSIIFGMRTDGTGNPTTGGGTNYGPTSIIGGPIIGYGGGGGTFSNMHIRLERFTCMVPVSSFAYCGPDLYGIGQASVDEFSYLPLAVIPLNIGNSGFSSTANTWPPLSPTSGVGYGGSTYQPAYTFGLRMPSDGNNAIADIGSYTSYFTQISLIGSEHTTFVNFRCLFSQYGLLAMTNTGGTVSHGITGLHMLSQQVRYPVGSVSSGYYVLDTAIGVVISRMDIESSTNIVSDAASKLYGEIGFNFISAATSYLPVQYGTGGTGIKLKRIEAAPGPIASGNGVTTSLPASGAAWNNYYYRDAWITLSATTITALSIGATAQAVPAAAATYSFLLPSGQSYTWSGTGTLVPTISLL